MQFTMNPTTDMTEYVIPMTKAGVVKGDWNPTFKNRIGHARLPGQWAYLSDQANFPVKVTNDTTIAIKI